MRCTLSALFAIIMLTVQVAHGAPGQLHQLNLTLVYSERGEGVTSSFHMYPITVAVLNATETVSTSFHEIWVGLTRFNATETVSTSFHMLPLEIVVLGREEAIVSSFHYMYVNLTRLPSRPGVVSSFHSIELVFTPFYAKVRLVNLTGCEGYACAGARHELVVVVDGSPATTQRVSITLVSGGRVVLELNVTPSSRVFNYTGDARVYAVEVKPGEGYFNVSVSLGLPWKLGDALTIRVSVVDLTGAVSEAVEDFKVVKRFDIEYTAPAVVQPGEEYTVTLYLRYSGTSRPAPPGMPVLVDDVTYYTGSDGSVVVSKMAPEKPGNYTIELSVEIPWVKQKTMVTFELEVVGGTGGGGSGGVKPPVYTPRGARVQLGGELVMLDWVAIVVPLLLLPVLLRGGRRRALTLTWSVVVLLVVTISAAVLAYLLLFHSAAPVVTKRPARPLVIVESVSGVYNESSGLLRLVIRVYNPSDKPIQLDMLVLEDSLGNYYPHPLPPVVIAPESRATVGVEMQFEHPPACPCVIRLSAGGVSAYASLQSIERVR